jgi:hypothetical protein
MSKSKKREIEQEKEKTEEIVQSFEFLRKINFIVSSMKETNEGVLHSAKKDEQGKDKGVTVLKVEFPETGGTFTYYQGQEYPVKGFAYGDIVEKVDEMKKLMIGILKHSLALSSFEKFKMLLMLLFFRKTTIKMIEGLMISFQSWVKRYRLKPIRYCRVCREIYRVGTKLIEDTADKTTKLVIEALRDILCLILEYDDAYRYRFQDIIKEMDKSAIKRNVRKELNRLFSILRQRDKQLAKKWRAIEAVISLFLIINKNIRKIIQELLLELNINEVVMDKGDIHHAKRKTSYSWQHYEQETEEKKEEQ